MSKKRILMVSPQFGLGTGGYERAAVRIARVLCGRGHSVDFVHEGRGGEKNLTESDSSNVDSVRVSLRPGLHTASTLLAFARYFVSCKGKYDIIHVHQYGACAAAAVLTRRIHRAPVVLKITNTGPDGIAATLRRSKGLHSLLSFAHRRVSRCIAISEATKREAIEFGIPEERVSVIPNGIDISQYAPVSRDQRIRVRQTLGLSSVGALVLFCGRIEQTKDPGAVVSAWRQVLRCRADALLVMIGSGSLEELIRGRASDISSHVQFISKTDNVLAWMQAADIYVSSSRAEGLSNALLEAMACGLPVVATQVSGAEDVFGLGDIGEMVPVGDAAELSRAMLRLLGDVPRRESCGRHSRVIAESHFSIDKVVDRLEREYAKL